MEFNITLNVITGFNFKKTLTFFITLMMFFSLGVQASVKEQYVEGMSNEDFIERFSLSVFGEKKDGELGRWSKPIRVVLAGSNKELYRQYRPKLEQIILDMSKLTGLDIAFREPDGHSNVVFAITSTPVFDMLVPLKGIAREFANSDKEFYQWIAGFEKNKLGATSRYIKGETGEIKACFSVESVSETMDWKSLKSIEMAFLSCLGSGRNNFNHGEVFTVFSPELGNKEKFSLRSLGYTEFDKKVIDLLYRVELREGMSYEQAKPIIQALIEN